MGLSRLSKKLFTTSGTWVAPAGVTQVTLYGIGAGGGGGGGGGGGITLPGGGGAGGGGAQHAIIVLTVVPGTTYTITIGAGGTGGVGGSGGVGGNGGDGGDTTFDGLATFFGAGFGAGGFNASTSTGQVQGGAPHRLVWQGLGNGAPTDPGQGGLGVTRGFIFGRSGTLIVQGGSTAAGIGGGFGGAGFDGINLGGQGGGGGGASTWNGMQSGYGNSGGPGYPINGGSGQIGPTFGAGGGGGGGGGATTSGQPLRSGATGETGGTGALIILWVE